MLDWIDLYRHRSQLMEHTGNNEGRSMHLRHDQPGSSHPAGPALLDCSVPSDSMTRISFSQWISLHSGRRSNSSGFSSKEDQLFLVLRISNELKDDAVFEIYSATRGASQISRQFVRMKCRGKCIAGKQFQRMIDFVLHVLEASGFSADDSEENIILALTVLLFGRSHRSKIDTRNFR